MSGKDKQYLHGVAAKIVRVVGGKRPKASQLRIGGTNPYIPGTEAYYREMLPYNKQGSEEFGGLVRQIEASRKRSLKTQKEIEKLRKRNQALLAKL